MSSPANPAYEVGPEVKGERAEVFLRPRGGIAGRRRPAARRHATSKSLRAS